MKRKHMLIKPSEVEEIARDILFYYENSDLAHEDKIKIMRMTSDHYVSLDNGSVVFSYLAAIANHALSKHVQPSDEPEVIGQIDELEQPELFDESYEEAN